MRRFVLWFFGFLLCGTGCFTTIGPSDPTGQHSAHKTAQWINDLGSGDFEVREAAMHSLIDLDEEPPALSQALQSPDLEVRRRVTLIRDAHVAKRAQRGLSKVHALAKEGRVEEMIQRLVLWKDWDQGKEREVVAALIARLVEWEHNHYSKTRFWSHNFITTDRNDRTLKKAVKEPVTLEELAEQYCGWPEVRRDEIIATKTSPWTSTAILIASGSIRIDPFMLSRGVILAGQHVRLDRAENSVIVCMGDLEVKSLVNCLVFARGSVTCSTVGLSTVISGDLIRIPQGGGFNDSVVLSKGIANAPIKFFDYKDIGLTVWKIYQGRPMPDGAEVTDTQGRPKPGDGVWIKEIREGTAFACGFCMGDIIVAIDSEKTLTQEAFRKVLCEKLAGGGPTITFSVRRAGKTLDVSIPVKD